MAVFFKTPAPPGVAAGLRNGVVVRAESLFEHRQLVRRRAPIACLWGKGADGVLTARWAGDPPSSDPVAEPLRLAVAR
jgi:hypothetical protein